MSDSARAPDVSVLVISRRRPLRLRWLLDALGDGGLAPERYEVLETRLASWRDARADVVAIVREDCLPAPGWLARALEAARAQPQAVVQGAVRPHPPQIGVLLTAPGLTAVGFEPPRTWAPPANLVARRATLERLDAEPGDGSVAAGARLRGAADDAGVPWVADPALVVWSSPARPERVRGAAAAVRRHPALRRELVLGVFTSRAHARLALALAGLAVGPRGAPLLAPWLLGRRRRDGAGARGHVRALARLPARTIADARSLAAAAVAAARERTLVL